MKKISPFFTALIMLLFTTTWSIKADGNSMVPADFEGKWYITELNGKKIVIKELAYIKFDIENKRIHANTGCNTLDTRYVVSGSNNLAIDMKNAFATLMLCPELKVLEDQIREAMGKITNFVGNKKIQNKVVDLKDDNGNTLLKLQR